MKTYLFIFCCLVNYIVAVGAGLKMTASSNLASTTEGATGWIECAVPKGECDQIEIFQLGNPIIARSNMTNKNKSEIIYGPNVNNNKHKATSRVTSSHLYLRLYYFPVSLEDAGIYKCAAISNGRYTEVKQFNVTVVSVRVKTKIDHNPVHSTIHNHVTITCLLETIGDLSRHQLRVYMARKSGSKSYPFAYIEESCNVIRTTKHKKINYDLSGTIQPEAKSKYLQLTIANPKKEDSGQYACVFQKLNDVPSLLEVLLDAEGKDVATLTVV